MAGQKNGKLINFLKAWPEHTVAVQEWLSTRGIYRQLVDSYTKSGWLERIGSGAFRRSEENVSWTGALYTLQTQMNLPIHLGGKSALHRWGLAHHLPLGKGYPVLLLGERAALPKWFKNYVWDAPIQFAALNLFKIGRAHV